MTVPANYGTEYRKDSSAFTKDIKRDKKGN